MRSASSSEHAASVGGSKRPKVSPACVHVYTGRRLKGRLQNEGRTGQIVFEGIAVCLRYQAGPKEGLC